MYIYPGIQGGIWDHSRREMRKCGRQDVYLTISPGTDLNGDTLRSLLSDFCTSDVSGCAQLCFDNNSTELWVGHVFSSLRREKKGKELCPFHPLRNFCERSGLPWEDLAHFVSGSAPTTAPTFYLGDMKGLRNSMEGLGSLALPYFSSFMSGSLITSQSYSRFCKYARAFHAPCVFAPLLPFAQDAF